jgi:serine/threonine protein kinase
MYFGYPCVVLEAIALGSLENFMYLLDWNESVKFVLELCEAVGLLHTNGIAHGRIKAPNILVTETMKPKLKGFRHAITPARNPEPTKSLPDLKQEDIYKVAELADLLLQRSVLPHTCSVYDDCDTCINPNCQADESAASTSGASMIGLEYVQDIEL